MNGTVQKNSFRKAERLCSRKEIDRLFADGHAFTCPPLKMIFIARADQHPSPSRIMFVVPKRSFRRAHDRNRIRRRMREAFRLRKTILYEKLDVTGKKISSAILYTGRKEETYEVITSALVTLLGKLNEKLG